MTGRPAYRPDHYLEDIKLLRRRGLTNDQIATRLGMSRRTLYRLLKDHQ